MAIKEKEIDLNAPMTITAADFMALFAKMQQDSKVAQTEASVENAKVLAEALEKLSPRYVDPKQKENIEAGKQALRDIELFKIKNAKRQQAICEHEQGQTGSKRLGEGAFCLWKASTGEVIGICTYCQKVISSTNPLHEKYFRKRGGTLAEAGQSTLNDPIAAQLARLSPDDREKVKKLRAEYVRPEPTIDLED